jgi:Putative lumazine-binding
MLRPVRSLVTALALLALVGCGDQAAPAPEEQVRSTVTEFGRATAAKDYRALCDRLLAPSLIEEVESIGLPCEVALRRGLEEVREPQLTIGRVEVRDDRATAEVRTSAAGEEPSEDTLELVNVEGTWKISSLGT